jgi:predicted alpha/beta hydrolase family esterase
MTTRVLFVHGAGEGTFEGSRALVESLSKSLGDGFEVDYPALPAEDEPDPREWSRIIEEKSADSIVVAHSVGASIALKHFSETGGENLLGLFTIAAPFWGGDGWHYDGYQSLMLPSSPLIVAPLFLFHGSDDEVVPLEHLTLFTGTFPTAAAQVIGGVGHDLGNDASMVARSIRQLGR